MQMEFIRKMPLPQELLQDYPIGADLKRRKAERDAEIADILTGRDDRLLLIIGPCSADREDAVLDYMHRLAELEAQVRDRLMIVPRVYTNTQPDGVRHGAKGVAGRRVQALPGELFPHAVVALDAMAEMLVQLLPARSLVAAAVFLDQVHDAIHDRRHGFKVSFVNAHIVSSLAATLVFIKL